MFMWSFGPLIQAPGSGSALQASMQSSRSLMFTKDIEESVRPPESKGVPRKALSSL